MTNKIFINRWLELKPYKTQVPADSYYLKLSNTLKNRLVSKDSNFLYGYLDEPEIDLLACFLASWFEDIISETNIWKTFTAFHLEHYGKILPFYDTKEYDEGDVNVQDIRFLIWYFLNTVQDEKFVSPYNDFIFQIADDLANILVDEYEYAPENKHLKTFYTIDKNETDYYNVRKLIDNLLFKTWLFYTDTGKELAYQENEIIEKNDDKKNLIHYLQETRDSMLHKSCTRLMSLKGKEWAAKLLGNQHPLSSGIFQISQRIRGYFLYRGQDENDIFIEHIASGKKFNLTKKSFDHYRELKTPDSIMFMGIVQWLNEWWFSGFFFQTPFNADLILDEKNSVESRKQVNFLDHQETDMKTILNEQLETFKMFNNGSPIAFMPVNKLDGFIKNYLDFHNHTLNHSEEEIEKAKKRAANEGYFGDGETHDFAGHEAGETGLVFFNPESGLEVAFNLNNAFPLKNNPYFDKNESDDDIMNLLMTDQISKELVNYCIDNCSNCLPFFKIGLGKMFLSDMDFLLRFWKRENYHARPEITFTGQSG